MQQIQRKVTRMVWEMEIMSYEDRLKKMDMFCLEKRWLIKNMLTVYKYLTVCCVKDGMVCFLLLQRVEPGTNEFPLFGGAIVYLYHWKCLSRSCLRKAIHLVHCSSGLL